MKTLIHDLPGLVRGGYESVARNLILGMGNIDHVVVSRTMRHVDDLVADDFRAIGAKVVGVTYPHLQFLDHWRIVMETFAPSAVLTYHFGQHCDIAPWLDECRDVHAAVHVGNPPQRDASYYERILEDPAANSIPIIFCSEQIRAAFKSLSSKSGHTFDGRTIYNAIDFHRFAEAARRDRPLSARGKFIVGMTGRFAEYKDHATLIRACARVPGVQLWLAGSGDLKPSLRQLADEVHTDTWWVGDVPPSEIPHFLRALDLFFFATTWREGFSLSLLEAMAAGCLIAASDVPSCREVLGGDVRLVKPTVDGYVRALESAMSLGAPARALSIDATQERARQFDVRPFVKLYRAILHLDRESET